MSNNILRRPAVEAKTGLSRASVYAMVQRGEFPKPVRIGAQAVGWIESEIEDWLQQRIAERDDAGQAA